MAEANYVKLTGNYYFDPAQKVILKKLGDRFTTVLHDRRHVQRPVGLDRRQKAVESPIGMKPIGHGLYWDKISKEIYRKAEGKMVLYTKDRRKTKERRAAPGRQSTAKDRRA
jgi:hypothetical protein